MSISNTSFYRNKVFRSGDIARAIRNICVYFGGRSEKLIFKIDKSLQDGSSTSLEGLSLDELHPICDVVAESVAISFRIEGVNGIIYFFIEPRHDRISVYMSADNAELLGEASDIFVRELGLEVTNNPLEERKRESESSDKAISHFSERLGSIELSLKQLQELVTRGDKTLRCFLSYRFSPDSDLYVMKIQRFLNLLNVVVITGNSYEPKPISEKVVSRLSQSIDFVVLLITASGESMWTRDEIAFAHGRGIPVIPLVEERTSFSSGLFGDQEYVGFSAGHISDTFIQLFEAVTYLRAQAGASAQSDDN